MTAALAEREMVAPAYLNVPERSRSMVEEVTKVCASIGRVLDAEQRVAVDALTSINSDGTPAALEGAIISARQNLKTFILEGIALTKLIEPDRPGVQPIRLGVWSAHLFDTAQETFRNFDELLAGWSHLSRRVKKISRGNGEEEIEFVGGKRLKFKARSKSGGRGLSGDFVILDEAFALQPGHMGALLPTLSTRRRAHVLYGSSAGLAESEVLRGVRDRGRAGGPGAPAYVEFCAPPTACATADCLHRPKTPGCALDREELWLLANPALGRRITVTYLRAERLALPPAEFARERLGWWDEPDLTEKPIGIDDWDATKVDPETFAKPTGRPVFFLDISPGMRSGAIAAGGYADGVPHVELADARPGAFWLVERAGELKLANPDAIFGYDAAGGVGVLIPELMRVGIEPVPFTGPELGRACGHLQKLSSDRAFTHADDPSLLVALAGAVKRDVGDGLWAWAKRKAAVDISTLVAATGALWLLEKHRDDDYDLMDSFG